MIFIASDHAGFDLKEKLKRRLAKVEDLGTTSDVSCDYPEFAKKLALKILEDPENRRGILICGTGIGMSIAANKIPGIRAAAVSDPVSAKMAREHNKAQILCLGARILSEERAWECTEAFLGAEFDEANPRHQRRIDLIAQIEKTPGTH